MKEPFGRYAVGYLIAVVATGAAVLLRWLLDPWMGGNLPFVTMFGAIAAAVWYGGYRPGFAATVLGLLACDYLFMDPRGNIVIHHSHDYIGLVLYLFTCSIIIAFGEALRRARRQADQQRESLRITLTSMGDAVITTDAEGRVASLNPVAAALTGWKHEDAIGRMLGEVFHIINEKTRQLAANPVKHVLAEGKVVGLANHTTLIAKDGTERPIDDSAAPIKDARGNILGVVLIFRDVSERRRADRAARALASIVESSEDAIIGKDVNGIVTSWNQAAERLFGYSSAEAIGQPISILAPPDRRDEMPQILERIRRGERVEHFDTVRRAKDGGLVPISLTVSPIRDEDGQIIGASKIARDIRERKRAEEAVHEEKARLHATLVSIGDAVIVTDAEGGVTLMNPVAQTLTGWQQEAVGRPLQEVFRIVNEYTRQPVESPVSRVFREGVVVGLANHTLLIAKDGTEWPIDDSAAPIRNQQGHIAGCVLVFRDISQRRRTEEELRRITEQLHIVTETMAAPITHCSRDLKYRWVSKSYAAWIGRPAEEIANHPIVDIIGKEAFAQLQPHFERVLSGEVVRYEERVHFQGIGPRWINAVYSPTFDAGGVPDGWVAVVTDIDIAKKAGERQRLLWEAATIMLSSADPDAMLREVFAGIGPHLGLDAYFNYGVSESGDSLRLVSSIGVADEAVKKIARIEFGQAICGTVALHRQPIVVTHVQQSDDPRSHLVKALGLRSYACHPLQINSELLGTLSFGSRARDQFDKDELDFLWTICHYVAVAYERLRLINRLREADRKKDEFLATLAHELRNPLAPIRSAVELLERSDGNAALMDQARNIVKRQLDQMVRLIDDLLDMSRISQGKVQVRKERVELAAVARSAVEAVRPLIDAQAHALTVTLPAENIYLDADPTRLAQVISNLLNNAAKYTEKGGHIWLAADRQDGEVIVSVRDTGIGIAPEHLPHIFEMFSQITPALERSQGGLGVGLALVHGLVELHGGKVEARSGGLGMGSEFIVRLPVAAAPAQLEEQPGDDQQSQGGLKRRVLVVDDNRDAADSMALMLKLMGHDTRTAYDGLEALQTAAGFRPAVILMDIGLPKMNGYEAARRIRQEPWGKRMALIALTGWGQEDDKRRALEAGFDHHLTKPVEAAVLSKLLGLIVPQR